MFCLQCGAQIDDDADFCPMCGAKTPVAPQPQIPSQPQPPANARPLEKKSRGGLIAIIVIAAVLVVAAIIVGINVFGQSDAASKSAASPSASSQAAQTSSSSASASSASASSSATVVTLPEGATRADNGDIVFAFEGVTITVPAKYANLDIRWVYSNEVCSLFAGSDTRSLGSLLWGEAAQHGSEIKAESFNVGTITVGGKSSSARFEVPCLDSKQMNIYAGSDTPVASTATEYYLGIAPEEVASWIKTNGGSPATASGGASTASASSASAVSAPTGVSTLKTPFWGVWISASKDLDEALATANEAWDNGFEAQVFMTTDWSNLNTEPWYVVSAGCTSSESEADAIRDKAVSSGYSGAYTKHSGDYQG